MATAKKAELRDLAVKSGLAKANDLKIFQLDVDALCTMLEDKYPGIRELDNDGVLELIAQVKKGEAGGKAEGRGRQAEEPPKEETRRGRGRRGEPGPEPEAAKDEPTKRGRGRRAAAAPAPATAAPKEETRRGRGRRGEPEPESAEREAPAEDVGTDDVMTILSSILEQLQAVGAKVAMLDAKVTNMDENVDKALQQLKDDLDEVHVGVESLYLDDISAEDRDLKDVLKRVLA